MQQRHMIDIPIGKTVRTADRAPIDGDYEFVEHLVATDCKPAGAEATVYLFRGELMPRCKRCGKRGIWRLADTRFEISPERDRTAFVLKEVRGDRPDVPYPSGKKK